MRESRRIAPRNRLARRVRTVLGATLPVLLLVAAACGPSSAEREFSKSEPELLAPTDGQQFNKYPRTIALEWRPLPGAQRYLVEIEMQHPNTGVWMPAPVDLNRQIVTEAKIFIEFPGAQPGRWRVQALDESNAKSQFSEWRRFEFLN